MKLYLNGHEYRYAIEQMLFSLYGSQRPDYPTTPPDPEEDYLISSLSPSPGTEEGEVLSAKAFLNWNKLHYSYELFTLIPYGVDKLERDRLCQYALKETFYHVTVKARQLSPPWGSLTGVRPVKLPTKQLLAGHSPEQAKLDLIQSYHVTESRADLAVDCAKASVALEEELHPNGLSLYIGIPFCPTRCSYCSFVSADVGKSLKLIQPYVEHLLLEIQETGAVLKACGKTVQTLYIGGGTPTTLSAQQLEQLFVAIETYLPLAPGLEYTLEAGRPDTITREKLELLIPHGVGRISINPQTMEEGVLRGLGRTHSPQAIVDCYHMAREIGSFDINMDLIAGLPQDTVFGFCHSLTAVLDLEPENITVHTLALKRGSTLTKQGGQLPTADDVAEMLDFAWKTLRKQGYLPYYLYRQKYMSGGFENISWTKPGHQNRYNIFMMEELHSVLSLGAGGITKLIDRQQGKVLRLNNHKYPHDYLSNHQKILEQKQQLQAFWQV